MSLKTLFGLEDVEISEMEIMARIKAAFERDIGEVEFVSADGSKVIIKLPRMDFSKYSDPWDGNVLGRGAA